MATRRDMLLGAFASTLIQAQSSGAKLVRAWRPAAAACLNDNNDPGIP